MQLSSASALPQLVSVPGLFEIQIYSQHRCQSDPYEKLVLFDFRLVFSFDLKCLMGSVLVLI